MMGAQSTFWSSIRNHSGWGWGLGEMGRNPEVLDQRGASWGETPLHWAILSHLEATSEILLRRPDLLSVQDAQGRTALDWSIEKLYFLREQQESEPSAERKRLDAMAAPAVSCSAYALQWISAQGIAGRWTRGEDSFVKCALATGELGLALLADSLRPAPTGAAVWLSGLAGLWRSEADVVAYVATLEPRYGYGHDSVVFGRPLGLHVAHLWATGQINADRAEWFHASGLRLDQETTAESIEVFCAPDGAAGASRLEKMVRRLGL